MSLTSHVSAQDECIGRWPHKAWKSAIWPLWRGSAPVSDGSPEAAPLVLCCLVGHMIEDVAEKLFELKGAERLRRRRAEDESTEAR